MANCTRDGNLARTLDRSRLLPTGIIVFYSALNIFLSITASLGNAVILVALHKVSNNYLHPTTKLLFRSLAVTDLCVGLFLQPLSAARMLNPVANMKLNIFCKLRQVIYASGFILCQVSVFTSTAISVDRLLSLLFGLRYRHVVTLERVRAVIACFWLIGFSLGLIYCLSSYRIAFTAGIAFSILCVFISIYSYRRIFLGLRKHQAKFQYDVHQRQPNRGRLPVNIARFKKCVSSIAWVQLTLVACYVPFNVSAVIIKVNGWSGTMTADIVWRPTTTLLFLNSSMNPILYCWKIRKVRRATKHAIRQCCCLSR